MSRSTCPKRTTPLLRPTLWPRRRRRRLLPLVLLVVLWLSLLLRLRLRWFRQWEPRLLPLRLWICLLHTWGWRWWRHTWRWWRLLPRLCMLVHSCPGWHWPRRRSWKGRWQWQRRCWHGLLLLLLRLARPPLLLPRPHGHLCLQLLQSLPHCGHCRGQDGHSPLVGLRKKRILDDTTNVSQQVGELRKLVWQFRVNSTLSRGARA
jgi:hypothetical protein